MNPIDQVEPLSQTLHIPPFAPQARPSQQSALTNPQYVKPHDAIYLTPAELVFGMSINDDHRAYPLRILACHEMFNDVVGGKPVALAY